MADQALVPSIAKELERLKPQIAAALPKHLSADRMARIALTEIRKNPKLAECDSRSLFASIIMASQLGLEPGVLGQCYLIPYKRECTFVPGWQGYVDLVSRTGRATVWTGAVFEGDEFEYQYGDRPFVHHKPGLEEDASKLRYVYAIGRINGSEWPVMEVWPMAKVIKHRDRFNKVGDRHYSFAHPEMYARKVVLLQVLKYMPKSAELTVAQNLDNAVQEGRQGITIDAAIAKEYEAPAAGGESDQEREARENCEELMRKQGFNAAQIEAKVSQNRGKFDQLLATLKGKEEQTEGGANGGGNRSADSGGAVSAVAAEHAEGSTATAVAEESPRRNVKRQPQAQDLDWGK